MGDRGHVGERQGIGVVVGDVGADLVQAPPRAIPGPGPVSRARELDGLRAPGGQRVEHLGEPEQPPQGHRRGELLQGGGDGGVGREGEAARGPVEQRAHPGELGAGQEPVAQCRHAELDDYKEPGGAITPRHVDQYYWPLSCDRTVTAWIPLQDTPAEMGPLAFAAGSQELAILRDIGIGDDSERLIEEAMADGTHPYVSEPFALGDVSFHLGWTFHRAGANVADVPRKVMTVIYVDQDIRITEPRSDQQRLDHEAWLSSAPVGGVPEGPAQPGPPPTLGRLDPIG